MIKIWDILVGKRYILIYFILKIVFLFFNNNMICSQICVLKNIFTIFKFKLHYLISRYIFKRLSFSNNFSQKVNNYNDLSFKK